MTKIVSVHVALAGVIAVTKEVWTSSRIYQRVHICFELVVYDVPKKIIETKGHTNNSAPNKNNLPKFKAPVDPITLRGFTAFVRISSWGHALFSEGGSLFPGHTPFTQNPGVFT